MVEADLDHHVYSNQRKQSDTSFYLLKVEIKIGLCKKEIIATFKKCMDNLPKENIIEIQIKVIEQYVNTKQIEITNFKSDDILSR